MFSLFFFLFFLKDGFQNHPLIFSSLFFVQCVSVCFSYKSYPESSICFFMGKVETWDVSHPIRGEKLEFWM